MLFPEIGRAQLCICYDSDGYANIRDKPSLGSKIIGKIVEGQIFAISYMQEENKSNDWIAANFTPSNNLKEKKFLKFDGEEKTGFVHKSRLEELETLPAFKIKIMNADKAVHTYKDVAISVETQAFKKSDHSVVKTKEGSYLIDGKEAYPYYGGDATEIKGIAVKSGDEVYVIPKSTFKNLFMARASDTKVYIGKKGEYYLKFDAGDGADFYSIVYCLKGNKIFSMTVTSTIP
ncbi:MAG TPA: SH3 domain-containing protein [Flavobacterium sp.]|nr:SH3 domain-containing protein [Flavobacterium sp.]